MNKNTHITRSEYASWILAALAMLFSLRLHLLPEQVVQFMDPGLQTGDPLLILGRLGCDRLL